MEGLKPPKKSHTYLFVVIVTAFIAGWVFFYKFRPQIVEAGCSEIAAVSSNIFSGKNVTSPSYEFEVIKTSCLLDANLQ